MTVKITEKWCQREREWLQARPEKMNRYWPTWCPVCMWRNVDDPPGTHTCRRCRNEYFIDRHGVTQEMGAPRRTRAVAS